MKVSSWACHMNVIWHAEMSIWYVQTLTYKCFAILETWTTRSSGQGKTVMAMLQPQAKSTLLSSEQTSSAVFFFFLPYCRPLKAIWQPRQFHHCKCSVCSNWSETAKKHLFLGLLFAQWLSIHHNYCTPAQRHREMEILSTSSKKISRVSVSFWWTSLFDDSLAYQFGCCVFTCVFLFLSICLTVVVVSCLSCTLSVDLHVCRSTHGFPQRIRLHVKGNQADRRLWNPPTVPRLLLRTADLSHQQYQHLFCRSSVFLPCILFGLVSESRDKGAGDTGDKSTLTAAALKQDSRLLLFKVRWASNWGHRIKLTSGRGGLQYNTRALSC